MKMDRDINPDGRGKYALVLMRNTPPAGTIKHHVVKFALFMLWKMGMIDFGRVGTPSEFFLIRLRDKFAYRALKGYQEAIALDPKPDDEYAQSVSEMMERSGPYSPFCKYPD